MTNLTVDMLKFIRTKATNDELNRIVEALKDRRTVLTRVAKNALTLGDMVTFAHKGLTYKGKVTAIKVKRATVACTVPYAATYQVPMTWLKQVA